MAGLGFLLGMVLISVYVVICIKATKGQKKSEKPVNETKVDSMNYYAGITIVVLIIFFVGYRLGKQSDNHSPTYFPTYISPSYSNSSGSEEKLEELKSSLEEARENAERAKNATDEVEHRARMRWLETGSFEDQIQMHDAEDATSQANDALDSIENSISNAE